MSSNVDRASLESVHAGKLQAWKDGEISLGKMAELIKMDKQELRIILADMNLPIIDYDAQEAIEEAKQLLES